MLNITEIQVKLVGNARDKLCAFACITLDGAIVVRDIKIIADGNRIFIAMPSRKLCDRCPSCGGKNHLRARFCSDCGKRLARQRADLDVRRRPRLYADIAHPINQEARADLRQTILEAYEREVAASKEIGYVATEFADMDYQAWSGASD